LTDLRLGKTHFDLWFRREHGGTRFEVLPGGPEIIQPRSLEQFPEQS
jgi:hypothetical protein